MKSKPKFKKYVVQENHLANIQCLEKKTPADLINIPYVIQNHPSVAKFLIFVALYLFRQAKTLF